MLIKITATTSEGKLNPVVISSDAIKELAPDPRDDSPSKSIIVTHTGFRYFAAESFEDLCAKLKLG